MPGLEGMEVGGEVGEWGGVTRLVEVDLGRSRGD